MSQWRRMQLQYVRTVVVLNVHVCPRFIATVYKAGCGVRGAKGGESGILVETAISVITVTDKSFFFKTGRTVCICFVVCLCCMRVSAKFLFFVCWCYNLHKVYFCFLVNKMFSFLLLSLFIIFMVYVHERLLYSKKNVIRTQKGKCKKWEILEMFI